MFFLSNFPPKIKKMRSSLYYVFCTLFILGTACQSKKVKQNKYKKLITTEDLSTIKVEHVEVSRLFKNNRVDNS